MEWLTIQDALQRLDGNVSAAARELGISRNRLYRKLREFA
jgi:transcriptional regulator of acetoin/glycerol metabolism